MGTTIWQDETWRLIELEEVIYLQPVGGTELCSIQEADPCEPINRDRGDHGYWRDLAERGAIRAGHVVSADGSIWAQPAIHRIEGAHPMGVVFESEEADTCEVSIRKAIDEIETQCGRLADANCHELKAAIRRQIDLYLAGKLDD